MLALWCPLNGNLNNQGLDVTSGAAFGAYSSSGKVTSKCFNCATYAQWYVPSLVGCKEFSVSYWVKISSSLASDWQSHVRLLDGASHIRFEACGGSYKFNVFMANNGSNKMFTTQISDGNSAKRDVWLHVAYVYSFSQSKHFLYVNGTLASSSSLGTVNDSSALTGYVQCGFSTNMFINDLRVYTNELLSEKEIKELSKGLCLHYKLSRGGENIATSTATANPNSFNDYTGKASATRLSSDGNTISSIYAITVPEDSATYSNYNLYVGVPRDTSIAVNKDGKTYTLSFKIKASKPLKGYKIYYEFNNSSITTDIDTTWKTVVLTGSATSQYSALYLIYGQADRDMIEGGILYVADMKLELGSVATPWIPNKSETMYSALGYNNIEFDCSGYGNNGTINGTLTYLNDTPRYIGSYKWNGDDSDIKFTLWEWWKSPYTISCWVKKLSSDRSCYIICSWKTYAQGYPVHFTVTPKGAVSNQDQNTTKRYFTSDGVIELNKWYHVTLVFDGTKNLIYVNGESKTITTSAISSSKLSSAEAMIGKMVVNSDSPYFGNDQISDIRIYATALSAADVKALYNESASLCDNYNFMVREVVEQ